MRFFEKSANGQKWAQSLDARSCSQGLATSSWLFGWTGRASTVVAPKSFHIDHRGLGETDDKMTPMLLVNTLIQLAKARWSFSAFWM